LAVNLSALKSAIESILEAANTTTASVDLSGGMDDRVQDVLQVNPAKIPTQPSLFPCVTSYIEEKEVEQATIAKDQLTARRKGEISLTVIGLVWNTIVTSHATDEADNDCEQLMENVEQILRANPTLNSTCSWQIPESVTYQNYVVEEGAYLRAGRLKLKIRVDY
jgi:hypothetical protein